MSVTRVFTSDNCSPVSEPILAAINAANSGMAPSYGLDDHTVQLERVASELFETDLKISRCDGYRGERTGTFTNCAVIWGDLLP